MIPIPNTSRRKDLVSEVGGGGGAAEPSRLIDIGASMLSSDCFWSPILLFEKVIISRNRTK